MEDREKRIRRVITKRRMGVFVVVMMVVALLAFAYYFTEGGTDTSNDVLVAVRGYLSVEQKDALASQFAGYLPEGEDAPITLRVFEFPVAGGGDTARMFAELRTVLTEENADLLLVDGYVYDLFGGDLIFQDLTDRYPNDPAVTGKYRYALAEKPFINASGLEELPELYLALRSGETSAVHKNAKTLKEHKLKSELLDNIANSSPPPDFAVKRMPEPEK